MHNYHKILLLYGALKALQIPQIIFLAIVITDSLLVDIAEMGDVDLMNEFR